MSKRKQRATRADVWVNPYASSARSKVRSVIPVAPHELRPEVCAAMFVDDDMAKRIVKELPEHAMRQGFEVALPSDSKGDESSVGKLAQALERWTVGERAYEADVWGRCFGGGFVLVGVADSKDQTLPLDETKIRPGQLRFLEVFDRRDAVPYEYYDDATEQKFGQPKLYQLQTTGQTSLASARVHESRLIRFGGALTPRTEKIRNASWDFSVLQCLFSVIQQSEVNWQSIGSLMADFAQGVFKIKDLVKIIAKNEAGVFEERMRILDQYRSSDRAILLDADKEDFERKVTPVSGAAELLDRTWQRVAAAAEMPLTVLMGTSPAGLNATGDSDIRLWYDRIQEHRMKVLSPRLVRLARIVAASEGIGIGEFQIRWPSLWQMTPTEEATHRKTIAETDAQYIDKGVVLPEEVALSRWGKGTYSTDMRIDLEARKLAAAAETKQLVEEAGKPDPATTPGIPPQKPEDASAADAG